MDLAMNDEASCFAGHRRCSGLTQASTGRHGHPSVRATWFSQRKGMYAGVAASRQRAGRFISTP